MSLNNPNSASTNSSNKSSRRSRHSRADKNTARIGFVGAGRLATAIITGLIVHPRDNPNEKPIDPKRIYVSAPSTINTDQLKITFPGIRITKRNIDIFGRFDCDIVFICVPPSVIRNLYRIGGTRPAALTTNYIPNMRHPVYVISLVFGFTNDQIKECLLNPENPDRYAVKFYRSVISHSIAYGCGNCWIDVEPDSRNFPDLIRDVLCRICRIEFLPSNQMDSVCTITGAGLAFCYYFINSIADGAVKLGFPRASAIKLASKIASSTSQTVLQTGENASKLKEDSSSPSGGAIYGQLILDKNEVSSGICAGIEAAYKRSQTLATADNE